MEKFDVAIIGTGPAGISAAITCKIRNKKILLLGKKNSSEKINKAHLINNYPGLPEITGSELTEKFISHITGMGIEITEENVSAVYSMGDYFILQCSGITYEAKSVIIATGVSQINTLDGEERFLGNGVSYCVTCDAQFYKGKSAAIIGYNKESVEEANYLSEIASNVIFLPVKCITEGLSNKIKIIDEIPKKIIDDCGTKKLVTDKSAYEVDGVFIIRDSIAPNRLVPGLEMSGNHIKVDINMCTNICGCFACGDIAGQPYQFIKAAGQGNSAALSAVKYLNKKEKNYD